MTRSIKKTFFLSLALFAGMTSAHAVLIQDFEVDASGITPIDLGDSVNGSQTNIIQVVASGAGDFLPDTNTSTSGGNQFLEVIMGFNAGNGFLGVNGDRVKWNDGVQVGGFQSGFGMRVDVFFENPLVDGGGFYGVNDGFFFQPTLLDDTNSFAVNGGGFGVRLVDDGGLVWRVGADGNAKGYSGVSGSTFDLIEGWFTMETIWIENGSGGVDQVNRLINTETSVVVLTETFANVLASVGDAGQLGAASLGSGDENGLISLIGAIGIDNVSIVPEPHTFAFIAGLFTLVFSVSRRRR